MALHYLNWQDIMALLDADVYPDPDIGRLNAIADDQEQRFDMMLSRQFDVPFAASTSPEAFDLARKVIARWAAAVYVMERAQAEGTEDHLWYPKQLEQQAGEWIGMLRDRLQPADAGPASPSLQFIPGDGLPAADTSRGPSFSRNHLSKTNTSRW